MAAMVDIEILQPSNPADLGDFNRIFTSEAKDFLGKLIREFSGQAEELQRERAATNLRLNNSEDLPTFSQSACRNDKSWKIADLPPRLRRVFITAHISLKIFHRFADLIPIW